MINAKPGRYFLILRNGDRVVVEMTRENVHDLYRRLVNPDVQKTYTGFGWITPAEHSREPVTRDVRDFL